MKKTLYLTLRSCKLHVYVAIWILLPVLSNGQQVSVIGKTTENYKTIFGTRYNEAFAYLLSNPWITDTLKAYHVDPPFATAIVFPELIRYSAIRDKIEVGGLFSLYVQYGQQYADFSVGRFQMKPTFARQLETDLQKLPDGNRVKTLKFDVEESEKSRLDRVKRLDSPLWQVRYLIYFVKVMDSMYASTVWVSQTEKLHFYATAYNCGYTLIAKKIKDRVHRKSFYITIVKNSSLYCYAEIAEDFFKTLSEKNN